MNFIWIIPKEKAQETFCSFGVTVKVMDLGVKCLLAENLRGRGIRADFGGYLEAFIIRMRKLGEDKDLGKILGGGFENVIKCNAITLCYFYLNASGFARSLLLKKLLY